MNLQDFATQLQVALDENVALKQQIERTEIYLKKLLLDSGGKIEIKPFESKEKREELTNYKIAFGITTIELI